MKIMLVCNGGMSTGILMKKMEKWAKEKARELEVKAYSLADYDQNFNRYDCILLGPQISYKENEIRHAVTIPVGKIESYDYATGNVENIMKQAEKILKA